MTTVKDKLTEETKEAVEDAKLEAKRDRTKYGNKVETYEEDE